MSITRRDFMVLTGGGAAGLALGVFLGDRLPWRQNRSGDDVFEPNAWLLVTPDDEVVITVARSEMGQGVRTALPMLVAEELDADWHRVKIRQAPADSDRYGDQSTDSSRSVRENWTPLRRAGAAARMMLLTAAARGWQVPVEECKTKSGVVEHIPTGRRQTYGELVFAARKEAIPEDPPLRRPEAFRLIGKSIPRTDIPAKVDGSAVFGMDVRVAGMVTATVIRAPSFGDVLEQWDDQQARAVPGVRDVLQIDDGTIAVVADHTWAAFQGRNALQCTWKPVGESSDAIDDGWIQNYFEDKSTEPAAVAREQGNATRALTAADQKLEAVYTLPFAAHATMEPMNSTAHVDGGRCTVWAPTQNPTEARAQAAGAAGVSERNVQVHTTFLGGGFGRRAETDFVTDAVTLSKMTGLPVKVVWTREEDMRQDRYRPASRHVMAAAIDGKRLQGWAHRVVAPSIFEQQWPGAVKDGMDPVAVMGADDLPYQIPDLRVDYVMANTAVPIGIWRSVGHSQSAFANECFLDEIAHTLGRDPVAIRIELLQHEPRHRVVLERAAASAGWTSEPQNTSSTDGRSWGIALHHAFGSYAAMMAQVSVTEDRHIVVHRIVCAVDCGMVVNPDIVRAQIEGGVVFGLTAALHGEVTIQNGAVRQSNFHDHPVLRMEDMPEVEVHLVESDADPSGIGEVGVPPVAPAVANAVFAATGERLRSLPLRL